MADSPSNWSLEGRTVLITGAARGIGAESAVRLHARGMNVALVGLEPDLRAGVAECCGGDRVAVLEADVTDSGALERAVAETLKRSYFGFIDTDLVRSAMVHPSSKTMERMLPAFVRRPVPVSRAGDAIERGVLGRRDRVWAPRYVGGALALRGILQPLAERLAMRDRRLGAALAQTDPAQGHLAGQDPKLGIAVPPADREPAGVR